MNRFICLPLLFLIAVSCKSQKVSSPAKISIKEGLAGLVLWREGNYMPSINEKRNKGTSKGIIREIYLYELTNRSQAKKAEEFYYDIKTKLITKTTSKEDGSFEVSLPAGSYSVFIKEDDGLYANIFDGDNNIFPVIIEPDKVTAITIIVDYKATY